MIVLREIRTNANNFDSLKNLKEVRLWIGKKE